MYIEPKVEPFNQLFEKLTGANIGHSQIIDSRGWFLIPPEVNLERHKKLIKRLEELSGAQIREEREGGIYRGAWVKPPSLA